MERISGIYIILSNKTKKCYVGESLHVLRRMERHKEELRSNRHKNIYLQRHVKKYGFKDLSFKLLEQVPDHKRLLEREIYWISFFESNDYRKGFNLNKGGLGGSNTNIRYKFFTLIHIKSGIIHTFKTVQEFEELTGLRKHTIREVLAKKKNIKSSHGWTTFERYNFLQARLLRKFCRLPRQPSRPPLYIKTFCLKNVKTGEIIRGKNILKFCVERNLCYNSLLRVIRGERKRHKEWANYSSKVIA